VVSVGWWYSHVENLRCDMLSQFRQRPIRTGGIDRPILRGKKLHTFTKVGKQIHTIILNYKLHACIQNI
jgi:hypothetical protein